MYRKSIYDWAKKLSKGNNTYDTSYYKFTCIKWYPSSKICSNCGNVKDLLKLDERIYKCDKCKVILDRDINATINIRNEGLKIFNNKT